jgi:hypothetical protein
VGVAGFLGGQTQEAASAGDTGLEPLWAFRPSTELISCFWPTWMVKVFGPSDHHLVWAGIWGHQKLLLAAVTHLHMFCSGQVSWGGVCGRCIRKMAAWEVEEC